MNNNIERKYGLPSALPTIQNGKLAPIYPLYLEHRGDNVYQFGGKYIGEIVHIYELLYKILTHQEIDVSFSFPYAIKITEDKLYIRNEENTEWVLIFDITKPNFPKEIELYDLIYKAISHKVIDKDNSFGGQFKIENNILYVRDEGNTTWNKIGDVTKEFFGATQASIDILDQINSILEEIQNLKSEVTKQISTANETLNIAMDAANQAMTNAKSINIRTFPSVSEMKNNTTLKAGALISTQGYFDVNDGGGTNYVVVDSLEETEQTDDDNIIELQNGLYAKYLVADARNKVVVFNTVADMKTSNKVKAGYTIRTLGYHSVNDGGAADYVIVDDIGDEQPDDGSIIALQKNLYAKLIVSDYVNVKQFGAYGDGEHDDTETIQKAINANPDNIIFFPNGIYGISNTIYTNLDEDKKTLLNLGTATIKALSTFEYENDKYMIYLGQEGTKYTYAYSYRNNNGVLGGTIDGNNIAYGGIKCRVGLAIIEKTTIKHCLDRGITIINSAEDVLSSDVYISKVYINGTYKIPSIALDIQGYDNKIEYVRTIGYTTGLNIQSAGNFFNSCHPLGWFQGYYDDIAFDIYKANNVFDNCYSDGFSTAFKVHGDIKETINNAFMLTGAFNKGVNTFLKLVDAMSNLVLVTNAVINFAANDDGRTNIGYDGLLTVFFPNNAGFINCSAINLTNYRDDNLLNSCLSVNKVTPFEIRNTPLNAIVGEGVWKIENAVVKNNNFPDISYANIYGILAVRSIPKRYNGAYAHVIQELTLFFTEGYRYFIRVYHGENDNPKEAASGWSTWKELN